MEGDEDPDAFLHQAFQEIEVMGHRGLVPLPFQGLDPAPFDRHPIGLVAQRGDQVHILPIQPVVVTGLAGGGAQCALRVCRVKFRRLLLVPRLGVGVVALDLMAGGGAAPEKAVGKTDERQTEDIVHTRSPWRI